MNLRKLYYSLDEASLLLANISPQEVDTVARAKSGNWFDWETACNILDVLVDLVEAGVLPTKHEQVIVCTQVDNGIELFEAVSQGDKRFSTLDYGTINTKRTKLSFSTLVDWCKENKIETDVFCESDNHYSMFSAKCITTGPNDKAILSEVEKLLNGTHPYQAEELKIAIHAWFNVTQSILNGAPAKSCLKTLSREISTISPNLSKATLDRISTVSNWNKKGNNDYTSRLN